MWEVGGVISLMIQLSDIQWGEKVEKSFEGKNQPLHGYITVLPQSSLVWKTEFKVYYHIIAFKYIAYDANMHKMCMY